MSIVTYKSEVEMVPVFPMRDILELACAAQRENGEYLKETKWLYDSEDKPVARKEPNRFLIDYTLGLQSHHDQPRAPNKLVVNDEDRAIADKIQNHFRKFMFSAVKGDNDFQTEINSILNSQEVNPRQFGYIACLPSVYSRDIAESEVKKKIKDCENSYLANIDTTLKDLDGDIIEVRRSNNFDAWNVCAIINNRLLTWFSKTELQVGPCVFIKGKVKEHRTHWKYKKSETRMNYVKVAQ